MITKVQPGDTVRVQAPEHKGKHYTALSVFYDLIEIEIGIFIEYTKVQKKYRNRYIAIHV
jgi:hypothetical protein